MARGQGWTIGFLGAFLVLILISWPARGRIRDFVFQLRRPVLPEARLPEARGQLKSLPRIAPRPITPLSKPARQGINLAVPFTAQAPRAIWDYVHEETCEEASVLMVDAFFDGRALGSADQVEQELQALVHWQKSRWGYFEDTTAEETGLIMREFYGYDRVEVVYDPTLEDIKARLDEGVPVIVPAYGRLLGNPFYTPPGPDYHMLVIRGYTKDGYLITNDPGTRRGQAWVYHPQVLWQAIHDWNDGEVATGRKVMIVTYPN